MPDPQPIQALPQNLFVFACYTARTKEFRGTSLISLGDLLLCFGFAATVSDEMSHSIDEWLTRCNSSNENMHVAL